MFIPNFLNIQIYKIIDQTENSLNSKQQCTYLDMPELGK